MGKRNQYNKPDLSHIKELTLDSLRIKDKLRLTGKLQVSSSLLVQGTAPEIRLKKSNPGAQMRMRIVEETICCEDLAKGGTNYNGNFYNANGAGPTSVAVIATATSFSGSNAIPVNSIIHAIGAYVGTTVSGAGDGQRGFGGGLDGNGIFSIGLTGSINDADYFSTASTSNPPGGLSVSSSVALLSASGDSDIFFPHRSFMTGGTSEVGTTVQANMVKYYTGITASDVYLNFECRNPPKGTGSITYAVYFTQFAPPNDSGSCTSS